MLKSLDVLIGISLVMLIVSMVVTLLTQFVTTAINSHGRNLKIGLQNLISHLDSTLTAPIAGQIAEAVLTHPLIGSAAIFRRTGTRLGTVIHRDELTRILMELASSSSWVTLEPAAKSALQAALKANGIDDVDITLDNVRSIALSLEESQPALASNARTDMAILQAAQTKFVGKINGWFDQTIDRVSERFTTSARAITFACALIVALAVQLDAIHLLNTLWINDSLTQGLVAEAENFEKHSPAPNQDQIKADQQVFQNLSALATEGLIVIPWETPANQPTPQESRPFATKVPGILLSTFLLSLGAPFWYSSLKTLLQMRSVIADKDDAQRIARQSDGVTGPSPPSS
jgi:hypothetical protein